MAYFSEKLKKLVKATLILQDQGQLTEEDLMPLYDCLEMIEPHHRLMALTQNLECYRDLQRLNNNLKLGRSHPELYTYTHYDKAPIDPRETLKS